VWLSAKGPKSIGEIGEKGSYQEPSCFRHIDFHDLKSNQATVTNEVDQDSRGANNQKNGYFTLDHATAPGNAGIVE
jgi:hypothetical protein